ncbi:hypothetical protein BDM02DRAFT_650101 [Thelephora ganbajun]|uniref:Uncharacterized protein n=1 Tax=Thelephora ganbajun TaxID=370292 RepID=A0ACB6ZPB6_THEGA|nr:hypothetical protein BDM02DRAFT_650101 [Thelephora ganbajun]
MEIDGLLEELMVYHPKRRIAITSVPLLPLPEEFPLTDEPTASKSPRSSKDSHFPSASPSLKSKRSFTPITPSTDGWRSPSTLASVPERKVSSDCFGHTKPPGSSGVLPPDTLQAPEDVSRDSYLSPSSENRFLLGTDCRFLYRFNWMYAGFSRSITPSRIFSEIFRVLGVQYIWLEWILYCPAQL